MIGIDIEKIERFKLNRTDRFLSENFTKKEIKYAYSKTKPEMHLCGMFCAKEALIKALDGLKISMKDIEIAHGKSGKPEINLLKKNMGRNLSLSISHCEDYATAVVLNENG